jgi:hypothetical protein
MADKPDSDAIYECSYAAGAKPFQMSCAEGHQHKVEDLVPLFVAGDSSGYRQEDSEEEEGSWFLACPECGERIPANPAAPDNA